MAHPHTLHKPVRAECGCCHLESEFTFKSRYDNVVCEPCTKHLGDHRAKARDTEHIAMWRASHEETYRLHYAETAALQRQITVEQQAQTNLNEKIADLEGALKADFNSRPAESVAQWLEQTKIKEAEERKAKAEGLIKHLFGVLLQIDNVHHQDENGGDDCTCGTPASKCTVYQALGDERGRLYRWEQEEKDKARAGQRHSLPRWHPDAQSTYGRFTG